MVEVVVVGVGNVVDVVVVGGSVMLLVECSLAGMSALGSRTTSEATSVSGCLEIGSTSETTVGAEVGAGTGTDGSLETSLAELVEEPLVSPDCDPVSSSCASETVVVGA